MASTDKTEFLGLNQWIGSDKPKRQDFVDDNKKIDNRLKELNDKIVDSIGYGVDYGLEVKPQTIPNMTVSISSGVVYMPDGTKVELSEDISLTVNAADITSSRIDIVYIDANGNIEYLEGIPSPSPVAPTPPIGSLLLAEINVAAITSDSIIDKRKMNITIEETSSQVNVKVDEINTQVTDIRNKINNLSTNDIEARLAIEELKLQMKEKDLLDFAEKNIEIGYMDTFTDVTSIDMNKTNAVIDTTKGNVTLKEGDEYSIRVVEDAVNSLEILSYDSPTVGDLINRVNEIRSVTIKPSIWGKDVENLQVTVNYNLEAMNGRRTVVMDNGWVIVAAKYDGEILFHVLKTESGIFERLGAINTSNGSADTYTIATYNNKIMVFARYSSDIYRHTTFNPLLVSGTDYITSQTQAMVDSTVIHTWGALYRGCDMYVNGSTVIVSWSASGVGGSESAPNFRCRVGKIGSDDKVMWEPTKILSNSNSSSASQYIFPSCTTLYNGNMVVASVNRINGGNDDVVYSTFSEGNWSEVKKIYVARTANRPIRGISMDSLGENVEFWWTCVTDDSNGEFKLMRTYSINSGTSFTVEGVRNIGQRNDCSVMISQDGTAHVYYEQTKGVNTVGTDVWKVDNSNGSFNPKLVYENAGVTSSSARPFPVVSTYKDIENPLVVFGTVNPTMLYLTGAWSGGRSSYLVEVSDPLTVSRNEVLTVRSVDRTILQFKNQTFPEFRNILVNVKTDTLDQFLTRTFTNNKLGIDFTSREFAIGDIIGQARNVFKIEDIEGSFDIDKVENSLISNLKHYKLFNESSGDTFIEMWDGNYLCAVQDVTSEQSIIRLFLSKNKGKTWSNVGTWG